jgi:surfactin synthase thioesterase subunit/glycosyltransferase involved in cell wall biosynthesis
LAADPRRSTQIEDIWGAASLPSRTGRARALLEHLSAFIRVHLWPIRFAGKIFLAADPRRSTQIENIWGAAGGMMRILLAQNSLYYPAHGGGDKSNRLLIEALAARGHECRVVARISVFGAAEQERYLDALAKRGVMRRSINDGVVVFERAGVGVHVVTNASLRAAFAAQLKDFAPEIILVSTDDPAQLLLYLALRDPKARVVYLARATLAVPFGPDCAFPSEAKAERIRACDAVVAVSRYVADYMRRYGAIDAVHVPISLMEPGDWPDLGRFENEFVTFVNPCAVKGIAIFLALADAFPETAFAAVPTWGTNQQDRESLESRPNVTLLQPVDDIDRLLAHTRVLLVPSLWAEARSRIILEAMLRGVPVMAADVGGIPEAMMGVPYLLPVSPIEKYETRLDEQMVPVAKVPEQNVGPWREALGRVLTDRAHYEEIAHRSRAAALDYARELHAGHFEEILQSALLREKRAKALSGNRAPEALSPERRKLLALRLRRKASAASWFPGIDAAAARRLFCFPHAGGGASAGPPDDLPAWGIVRVRLPGRESRLAEAPFERMGALVTALANAMEAYLDRAFAFFGHSMGAVVAFELARELRRRGRPAAEMLIASGARAPQFRRDYAPAPPPTRAAFFEELGRLQGIPAEVLGDPALMRAILPALEADAALYRTYVYAEEPPLSIPIRAYGGAGDPNVSRAHLTAWGEQTTASFAMRVFPGGHFYLNTAREDFRRALEADLSC